MIESKMDKKKKLHLKNYYHRYYRNHLSQKKEYSKKYYHSHKEYCSERAKKYYQAHREVCIKNNKIYNRLHPKKVKRYRKFYHKDYLQRPEYKEKGRFYRRNVRIRAMKIIGKGVVKCSRCGCDNVDLVEINHKKGGGKKELGRKNSVLFYFDIIYRRRKINDLNLLCKVCNWAHYVKLRYGERYKIEYVRKKTC
jgi:hypothetical protein